MVLNNTNQAFSDLIMQGHVSVYTIVISFIHFRTTLCMLNPFIVTFNAVACLSLAPDVIFIKTGINTRSFTSLVMLNNFLCYRETSNTSVLKTFPCWKTAVPLNVTKC